MSRISDRIKKYISCPQFGNEHYGEWGILTLEQRRLIKELVETCDMFEETADYLAKQLKETTERLFEFEQILKENNFEDTGDLKIFVTLAFKFGKQRKKEMKEHQKLKHQLAEEKNRNKKLNHEAQKYYEDAYCNNFQNQTAIDELEKVKVKLNEEINNANVLLDPVEYEDYHELLGVIRGYKLSVDQIDQQIKSLKGEK